MARILVLDDEATIRFVVSRVLEGAGHEVVALGSGREALELLAKDAHFDVFLMDLRVGDMTGRTLLTSLREWLPVIDFQIAVLTGAVDTDEAFPPPDWYQGLLRKPFKLAELKDLVERLVNSHA